MYKNMVVKLINRKRGVRAKGIPNISAMIIKLKAMIFAEEIG